MVTKKKKASRRNHDRARPTPSAYLELGNTETLLTDRRENQKGEIKRLKPIIISFTECQGVSDQDYKQSLSSVSLFLSNQASIHLFPLLFPNSFISFLQLSGFVFTLGEELGRARMTKTKDPCDTTKCFFDTPSSGCMSACRRYRLNEPCATA